MATSTVTSSFSRSTVSAFWTEKTQMAMAEREKELVTVEVTMVSCCSEVNFSFKKKRFSKNICRTFVVIGVIQSLIKNGFAVRLRS